MIWNQNSPFALTWHPLGAKNSKSYAVLLPQNAFQFFQTSDWCFYSVVITKLVSWILELWVSSFMACFSKLSNTWLYHVGKQEKKFNYLEKWLAIIEQRAVTFGTCTTYVGYLWSCSVRCQFRLFGALEHFSEIRFSKCGSDNYDSISVKLFMRLLVKWKSITRVLCLVDC